MGKQIKTQELAEFKMEDTGNGSFSGYASTFGNYDSVKEAVVKGAFADTLEQFKANGFIALNHDWNGEAIAFVKNAFEDDKGLFVECEFHSTTKAQEIRKIMQERAAAGKSNRMSIGYRVVKSTTTAQGKQLDQIRLYEASIVNVPANELASITSVKGDNGEGDDDDTEGKKAVVVDLNSTFVKALLLGDDIESEMLLSGMERLFHRLYYQMYRTMGDSMSYDQTAKISICNALLDEFASIGKNAVQSFLADPNAIATASAKAAELKAGRALSGANRASLKSWSESMKSISSEIETLLAETDDGATKTDDKTKQDEDEKARKAALELELAAMGL
jgi:HK97 family phage prohead protease